MAKFRKPEGPQTVINTDRDDISALREGSAVVPGDGAASCPVTPAMDPYKHRSRAVVCHWRADIEC